MEKNKTIMTTLLQSRNWWIEKGLKWIIYNADFIFWDEGDNRPYIVTNSNVCSCNCFKLDIDKYGITLNSYFKYDDAREKYIIKKGYHVKEDLITWIKVSGEDDVINPSAFHVMIANFFRSTKRKDIIIEI